MGPVQPGRGHFSGSCGRCISISEEIFSSPDLPYIRFMLQKQLVSKFQELVCRLLTLYPAPTRAGCVQTNMFADSFQNQVSGLLLLVRIEIPGKIKD